MHALRIGLVLIAALVVGTGPAPVSTTLAQSSSDRYPAPTPAPQPQPGAQVPPARACQTQWGVCQIPCCVPPGTPCSCTGASNTLLPGYAVQYFRPQQ
jgi:hypothetical protein